MCASMCWFYVDKMRMLSGHHHEVQIMIWSGDVPYSRSPMIYTSVAGQKRSCLIIALAFYRTCSSYDAPSSSPAFTYISIPSALSCIMLAVCYSRNRMIWYDMICWRWCLTVSFFSLHSLHDDIMLESTRVLVWYYHAKLVLAGLNHIGWQSLAILGPASTSIAISLPPYWYSSIMILQYASSSSPLWW